MMRTIHLHGHLRKKFGATHRLDVATAGEALRALNAAFPGKFMRTMQQGSYRVIRGKRHDGFDLGPGVDLVMRFNLGEAELHFVPVAAGAKSARSGGAVKAILGVALVGAAIFFSGGTLAAPLAGMGASLPGLGGLMTWGNVAILGLGLALSGAASMMSKADEKPTDESKSQSYSLNGANNTYEQGNPVQLIYGGPLMVGSQPISTGLDIEDLAIGANANGDEDGDGIPDSLQGESL